MLPQPLFSLFCVHLQASIFSCSEIYSPRLYSKIEPFCKKPWRDAEIVNSLCISQSLVTSWKQNSKWRKGKSEISLASSDWAALHWEHILARAYVWIKFTEKLFSSKYGTACLLDRQDRSRPLCAFYSIVHRKKKGKDSNMFSSRHRHINVRSIFFFSQPCCHRWRYWTIPETQLLVLKKNLQAKQMQFMNCFSAAQTY